MNPEKQMFAFHCHTLLGVSFLFPTVNSAIDDSISIEFDTLYLGCWSGCPRLHKKYNLEVMMISTRF